MTVLAIDPGSEQSAYVLWDGEKVLAHGKEGNLQLRHRIRSRAVRAAEVVIEMVQSYGMAVGAEVFETCVWSGRLIEAALHVGPCAHQLPRRDVKLHLCGQARAKDANVRQALIDRFGGKERAIGTKKAPGPLYGLKADEWQALALAVTWFDLHGKPEA